MADKKEISVIYALKHNVTGKIYIGKTKDLYKRYALHLCELKSKRHKSKGLQEAFDKYGDDFSLYILEEIEDPKEIVSYYGTTTTKVRIAEIEWMKKYDTLNSGYNVQDHVSKVMALKSDKFFPLTEGKPELPKMRKEK